MRRATGGRISAMVSKSRSSWSNRRSFSMASCATQQSSRTANRPSPPAQVEMDACRVPPSVTTGFNVVLTVQEVGQHGPLPFVGGALQQLQLVEARQHHVIVGHQRPDPARRAAARIPEYVYPHGRVDQGRHEPAASPCGRSPDAASPCLRGPEDPSCAAAAPARSARDAPAPACANAGECEPLLHQIVVRNDVRAHRRLDERCMTRCIVPCQSGNGRCRRPRP